MRETAAAQRLRGYEVGHTRNPIRRIRRVQPLVVPVALSAFIDAEDVADALDHRGFGTQRRTWLHTLRFDVIDLVVVGVAVAATMVTTATTLSGHMPDLWVW